MKLLGRLWNDEAGFVVTIELTIIATIAVIGLIVGLATLRDSVTNEIVDVAGAIDDLNQSYEYTGIKGHSAVVAGADFLDENDFCDNDNDTVNAADQCVVQTYTGVVVPEGTAPMLPSNLP